MLNMSLLLITTVALLLYNNNTVTSEAIQYVYYTVEDTVSYNGNSATTTSTDCHSEPIPLSTILECEPGSKLDDDILLSLNYTTANSSNTQYEQFFAFNRQSNSETSAGILQFYFPTNFTNVINIVLHFLYYPERMIGLPSSISLHSEDNTLPYYFNHNDDLHSADNTVRNVTLVTEIPTAVDNIIINITFKTHDMVDWLLLSEVDFYNNSNIILLQGNPTSVVSIGPDDLQSTVSFTCTVTNPGSFDWIWEYNGQELIMTNSRYKMWIADATRSSQLVIRDLRYGDNGNYTCKVKHKKDDNNYRYKRIFLLDLRVNLKAESNEITFPNGSTATLVCEAYGYLPSDIQWMKDGQLITAKGNYSLTTSSGNIDSIGSNGAIQKSQIISMHITEIDETIHNGVYVCKLKDIISINITLTIGTLVASPSPIEVANCIPPNVLLIQILLTIIIGIILVAINILCMELARRKHSTKIDSDDKSCQVNKDDMFLGLRSIPQRAKSLELPITYDNFLLVEQRNTKSLNELSYSMETDVNDFKQFSIDQIV